MFMNLLESIRTQLNGEAATLAGMTTGQKPGQGGGEIVGT